MDFDEVVRARRMVRSFRTDPVDPGLIDRLLGLAVRSPSAGNTWGTHFVVLEGDAAERYWELTLPEERRPRFAWPRLLDAPVLVIPCGDAGAYVARYAEPDKASTGLGESTDEWAIPYWHVDTAMATMTLLHAATDAGLGGLFFGLFGNEEPVCQALGIPPMVRPIGAVALGWPTTGQRRSRSAERGLPPLADVVHRGSW